MIESTAARNVGARIKPVEDRKLISGRGSYLDDIQLPAMGHAAFARSPHAHARVKGIDVSQALELPGVLAVRTGPELNSAVPPLRLGADFPHVVPVDITPLASDRVRYVGEAVAIVVATDRYVAEDAVDLIKVDYEPLPPVLDPIAGAQGAGTPLYDGMDSNIVARKQGWVGDTESALRQAHLVVKDTFRQQRYTHIPMECRGILADWNPGSESLTLRGSFQMAHALRALFAEALGLAENKVRIVVPDVGGAFGQKSQVYGIDLAVCLASMELGIPVKWTEDRQENLLASGHAREHIIELEVAVESDGTILGVRAHLIDDIGASPLHPWPADSWVSHAVSHLPNHYKFPAYSWETVTVLTNKSPEAPYRGPGSAASSWAMEGTIDIIARELGLDPVEIRMRNMVLAQDQPYVSPGGNLLENLSSVETFEQALEMVGYPNLLREQQEARKKGRYLGIGIGSFSSGAAADEAMNPVNLGLKGSGQEVATVRMLPTGRVQAFTSVSPHGQGLETTLAQILSDELGVPMDTVEILHGDSDMPAEGGGTWGDRSAILGGGAIIVASRDLKGKLVRAASRMLEAREQDLDLRDGYIVSTNGPQEKLPVADLASAIFQGTGIFSQDMVEGTLTSTRRYEYPKRGGASNGAHVAVVEVDGETGAIEIVRYVGVEDVGQAINPIVVEGQIRGCVAQGLGGVLLEELTYDGSGQLLTTTFMDYLIPEATDLPDIEIQLYHNPTPDTLGGFKSAGEGGICGAICALSNAVADALSPFGVRINELPLKPHRILELMGKVPKTSHES